MIDSQTTPEKLPERNGRTAHNGNVWTCIYCYPKLCQKKIGVQMTGLLIFLPLVLVFIFGPRARSKYITPFAECTRDVFSCGCGWVGTEDDLHENGECPKCNRAEEVIDAKR